MKKGFTFAEMMMVLAIAGVIGALMLRSVKGVVQNYKPLYKAAYKVAETAVSDMINDSTIYSAGNFFTGAVTERTFCDNFTSRMNAIKITGTDTCGSNAADPSTSADPGTPNLVTTNGMRWWRLYTDFTPTLTPRTIYVDVNGTKGPNRLEKDILRLHLYSTGRMTVTDYPENTYME